MPLAAILCATAPSSDRPDVLRGQIVFATQSLIEYQVRQAAHAGARLFFIMIDAVSPSWSRMVDRLAADGLEVHLVRDMATLVRHLPRDGDTLLFADGMIVDQRHVNEMGALEGNGLLAVEDSAATAHLERIDGHHRWAGIARISPQTMFDTLDLIGDWDLALTLVRAVVQNEPHRIIVPQTDVLEGRVALVDRQETADLVGKSLAGPMDAAQAAGAERYVLQPITRRVATRLLRLQIPAEHIRWGATGIALLGLAMLIPGWHLPALLLFIVALGTDKISGHVASMTRMPASGALVRFAPAALGLLGIAWTGVHFGMSSDGLHLALLSAITLAVLDMRGKRALPDWAYMTPGSAILILLFGMALEQVPLALSLGALLAIISVGAILLAGRKARS